MRISINQFVKEVTGHTGTLCAVLADGTTTFPLTDIDAQLTSINVSITADDKLFIVPRNQIASVDKMVCNSFTPDNGSWIEYEITTIPKGTVTIDVKEAS